MVDHEDAKEWLLCEDTVVSMQAATAVGDEGLTKLVAGYKNQGALYEAAKTFWATVSKDTSTHSLPPAPPDRSVVAAQIP